jgi:hypothetical protein
MRFHLAYKKFWAPGSSGFAGVRRGSSAFNVQSWTRGPIEGPFNHLSKCWSGFHLARKPIGLVLGPRILALGPLFFVFAIGLWVKVLMGEALSKDPKPVSESTHPKKTS